MPEPQRVSHIFHPTSFEAGGDVAFLHALRLTVSAKASLTILHVGDEELGEGMRAMPHVRTTLKQWGVITDEEGTEELRDLGVGIKKVLAKGEPVQACLDYLEHHPTNLIVLHTHQREGRSTWLTGRVAEPLTRDAKQVTLLVPEGVPGFVDARTGEVKLQRILIPIAEAPSPQINIDMAADLASLVGASHVEFHMLHVGNEARMPRVHVAERDGWTWNAISLTGDVVDTILKQEQALRPDLVVMSTQGHNGFLDALRGSTTERVLRHIRCPLLTAVTGASRR